MVSFSCEGCGDVLTKKKLDPHRNQCRGASFTCIDCMVHFQGTDYRAHTSCMSEAQKYQGALYREKDKGKKGDNKRKSMQGSQAMVPRNAYVEDAPEDSQAVAVIDVPPRAPTPPPANSLPEAEGVNVFDFLVSEPTPNGKVAISGAGERKMLGDSQDSMYAHGHGGDSQYSQYSNGDGRAYTSHGFSYGDAPVQPSFERYDSWNNLTDGQASQGALMPPPYTTPAPKKEKREKGEKSDKKRKRTQVDDLDLSAAKRPVSRGDENMVDAPATVGRVLHTGLTGGLHKLVTDPDFYEDRIDAGPTPISPIKRSKRGDTTSNHDKRKSSRTVSGTTTTSSSSRRDRDREREKESYHDDRHRRQRQPTPSSSPEPPRKSKAIEYPGRASSVQPTSQNQVGHHFTSKAEHFLSFINKGPDSERGLSINKALKRYHRERGMKTGEEKEEDDKELWKMLRLRKNERGEIVVFM